MDGLVYNIEEVKENFNADLLGEDAYFQLVQMAQDCLMERELENF